MCRTLCAAMPNWNNVIEAMPYLLVVMAFLLVRLMKVFTTHQQKMAQILNQTNVDRSEIQELKSQIAELNARLSSRLTADDPLRSNLAGEARVQN